MNKKILSLFLVAAGLMMGSFASAAYCSKTISQTPQGWFISRVLLTGADISIDNTTSGSLSANNYDYFSGLTAPTLVTGQSYTLSIRSATGWQFSVAAWIDRNGNEVFDTGFDYLGQTDGVLTNTFTTFSFTVPMTGTIGTTRLRIVSAQDAPALLPSGLITPCGAQNDNGENEEYNVTIAASYTAPVVAWGGKRRVIPVDFCPDGDFSMTQYDGLCAGMSATDGVLATGTTNPNPTVIEIIMISPPSTWTVHNPSPETEWAESNQWEDTTPWVDTNVCDDIEIEDAFVFAHKHGITTMETCMKARTMDTITRAETAKMISSFAMNVLEKTPNASAKCSFNDLASMDDEMANYAVTACHLGLMGLKGDGTPSASFNPNDLLDKAQFATILSRLIYGDKYNTSDACRYCKHIEALKANGIINVTTDLFVPLKRGRALLMLMRIGK